jgi:hypothetical protein
MKRFIIALAFAGLLIIDHFSPWHPVNNLSAQTIDRYSLQVASLPTKISAQKEIERLKSHRIQAQAVPWEDRSNKTWFIIYIMGFQTKEEATQRGEQLIQNGIIRNFRVSSQKSPEETPVKVEKPPLPSPPPSKKESIPISGNSPVYTGSIFPKATEEEKPAPAKGDTPIPSISFRLQVASCSTLAAAQKEVERLKSLRLKADYSVRQNQSRKKVFIIYLDRFKSQEEATQKGNQLVQKKIIKNFKVFTEKTNTELLFPRAKEASPVPTTPSKKEPSPSLGKNPVYFGPISIKEEENSIRINIILDRKVFPEITVDKIAQGSRLIVTFKNINRYIVPIEFDKVQSKALLSLSLAQKGSDCTFIIVLSSAFNYDVAQNYFEREKIYSLVVGMEPAIDPSPVKKE